MSAVLPASATELVPSPARPAGGFFAHHGIWAPGVRLFRRLRFAAKAVTISSAFMLPMLGLLAWLLATQAEQAQAARLEATRAQVQFAQRLLRWAHAQEATGGVPHERAQRMARDSLAALQSGDAGTALWLVDLPTRTVQVASADAMPPARWLTDAAIGILRRDGQAMLHAAGPAGGPDVDLPAVVQHFEPWDWVVGAQLPNAQAVSAHQLAWVGGIVALVLLAAGYLFLSFYRVMDGGLRESRRHLRAMAEGDLGTTLRAWGQDESAQLMLEMCRLQESLRGMVRRVRDCGEDVVAASDDIADGAAELSARTEHAATELERSAASMAQISATVKSGTEHTDEAARIARHNAGIAADGGQVMREVVDTMAGIRGASAQIAEIVGTIDGIAFQTNILALNAAVEAARAGAQGRGFAVVAHEVRLLAQRSAEAAKEIKTLIAGSVQQVEAGTLVVRKAGAAMQEIVATSQRVNELLGEVAAGAREQSQGIGEVGRAVTELDRVTQQNAALVEQTAQSATAMREQAQALAEAVACFKLPADS